MHFNGLYLIQFSFSTQQSFFIMSVFAFALLAPAGWILHHLPEYRQRSEPPPS
uniref:Uncharacterized protein n=1 Tax=Pygocentrus nattereri TaxID=42514 RepID=A0A3B4DK05_PYGNA